MNKEKTIDILNKLVVTNNERIEGYETASENTEERELKTLFSGFVETSQKCRNDLVNEIKKLGGKAEGGTKVSGKFFRAWMDVKSALTGKDRKATLDSCEEGEEKAIESYRSVFEDETEHLTSQQQTMLKDQHGLIKNDLSKIRSMQDSMAQQA